jgi:hypothetical protein
MSVSLRVARSRPIWQPVPTGVSTKSGPAALAVKPRRPTRCGGRTDTQTAGDRTDDCTIWYVGDYLKRGAANFSTRIGASACRDAGAR